MTIQQLAKLKPGKLIGAYVDRQWQTVKITAICAKKLSFFVNDDPMEFELTCDIDSAYFRDKVTS